MENKKIEKKRIFSKLTVGVAALALISCAFVGGTFARYTTGETEADGGANIADWYIDVEDGSGADDVVFTISPYYIAWEDGQGGEPRTNALTEGGMSLKIINKGEVSANVEITVDDEVIVINKVIDENVALVEGATLVAGSSYTDRAGNTYTWTVGTDGSMRPTFTAKGANVSQTEYNALVTAWAEMALYESDEGKTGIITIGTLSAAEYTSDGNAVDDSAAATDGKYTFTLTTDESVELSISNATWTSDTDSATTGTNGDIRDTWIGENIAKVGYTITWEAEQSSTYQEGTVSGGGTAP